MRWECPAPDWDTLAGREIDRFLAGLSEALPEYDSPLTVFGSAAIQLCLDDRFTSADVDVMVISQSERLRDLAKQLGVGRSGGVSVTYELQICPPQLFLTTPHYLHRAWVGERHGLTVVVPHVREILVGKLHRFRDEGQRGLAAKNRRAFERVRELSNGRPFDSDMLEDLRLCEASLRAPSDGAVNFFRLNVLDLFRTFYQRELDLESEVHARARRAISRALGEGDTAITPLLDGLEPTRD